MTATLGSSSLRTLIFFSAMLLVLIGSWGCGGRGTVTVEGQIFLDDQPLANATISFAPNGKGRPANGVSDANGKFRMSTFDADDGVLPGEYKITVTKFETADQPEVAIDLQQVIENSKKPAAPKKPAVLHENYANFAKTPLSATVPPKKIELRLTKTGT